MGSPARFYHIRFDDSNGILDKVRSTSPPSPPLSSNPGSNSGTSAHGACDDYGAPWVRNIS